MQHFTRPSSLKKQFREIDSSEPITPSIHGHIREYATVTYLPAVPNQISLDSTDSGDIQSRLQISCSDH